MERHKHAFLRNKGQEPGIGKNVALQQERESRYCVRHALKHHSGMTPHSKHIIFIYPTNAQTIIITPT